MSLRHYSAKRTYHLLGLFFHAEYSPDGDMDCSFSGGVDNTTIIDKVPFALSQMNKQGDFMTEYIFKSFEDMNRFRRALTTADCVYSFAANPENSEVDEKYMVSRYHKLKHKSYLLMSFDNVV